MDPCVLVAGVAALCVFTAAGILADRLLNPKDRPMQQPPTTPPAILRSNLGWDMFRLTVTVSCGAKHQLVPAIAMTNGKVSHTIIVTRQKTLLETVQCSFLCEN